MSNEPQEYDWESFRTGFATLEPQAVQVFLDHFVPAIKGFLLSRMNDPQVVDEIVRAQCEKLYRGILENKVALTTEKEFRAFLKNGTVFARSDYFRIPYVKAETPYRFSPDEDQWLLDGQSQKDVEQKLIDRIDHQHLRQLVEQFLAGLQEAEGMIGTLCLIYNVQSPEVARVLDHQGLRTPQNRPWTAENVRKTLQVLRSKLRRRLRRQGMEG